MFRSKDTSNTSTRPGTAKGRTKLQRKSTLNKTQQPQQEQHQHQNQQHQLQDKQQPALPYDSSSVSASTVVNDLSTLTNPPTTRHKGQRLDELQQEIVSRQVSWGAPATAAAKGLAHDVVHATAEDRENSGASGAAFWGAHDRRISMGGENSSVAAREIVDAMVDDLSMPGWAVDEGRGTFNDVLGSTAAMHPVVLAFARAHIEGARACLGVEHVWLAVLQGTAAMLRTLPQAAEAKGQPQPQPQPQHVSLSDLWQALRDSSDVPGTLVDAQTGRHVRVFGDDVYGRHALHAGRGAAPLAMAAAAAGHRQPMGRRVEYGRMGSARPLASQRAGGRQASPQWMQALRRGPGCSGLTLAGSIQGWAALCVLVQQLKQQLGGRARSCDWWLHRVHLLCRDLADYFAAQGEFGDSGVPPAWARWVSMALFDGHSGAPPGDRLDGWLGTLFCVDAAGEPIHAEDRWWVRWEDVPSGIDLVRVAVGARQWVNLYSGFVGVQALRRDAVRSRGGTRTLLGEDLEAAFGIHQQPADLETQLSRAYEQATAGGERAVAPLVGWALDS
ncbi:hypothetical protein GGF37_005149 [Kickxella alabastrina]|nr:hypothetical protein GGF37_005149 [Kickxella alabastrina]